MSGKEAKKVKTVMEAGQLEPTGTSSSAMLQSPPNQTRQIDDVTLTGLLKEQEEKIVKIHETHTSALGSYVKMQNQEFAKTFDGIIAKMKKDHEKDLNEVKKEMEELKKENWELREQVVGVIDLHTQFRSLMMKRLDRLEKGTNGEGTEDLDEADEPKGSGEAEEVNDASAETPQTQESSTDAAHKEADDKATAD